MSVVKFYEKVLSFLAATARHAKEAQENYAAKKIKLNARTIIALQKQIKVLENENKELEDYII